MKIYYPGPIVVIILMLVLSSVTQKYKKQGKPIPLVLRVGMVILGVLFIALGILVIVTAIKQK